MGTWAQPRYVKVPVVQDGPHQMRIVVLCARHYKSPWYPHVVEIRQTNSRHHGVVTHRVWLQVSQRLVASTGLAFLRQQQDNSRPCTTHACVMPKSSCDQPGPLIFPQSSMCVIRSSSAVGRLDTGEDATAVRLSSVPYHCMYPTSREAKPHRTHTGPGVCLRVCWSDIETLIDLIINELTPAVGSLVLQFNF